MQNYASWVKKSVLSLAIVTSGLFVFPAQAQIESASLRGKIVYEGASKAGVEVFAIDVDRGYTSKTTTRADGSYIFVGLKPGRYRIQIGDEDGAQNKEMTLRIGQSANLNFGISSGSSGGEIEEVTVTGTRIEEFQGGEVGTIITPELMARLPQGTRNFLAFAELAPGVQFNQGSDGSTSIRGGAQHQRGVNVFLDGVSQKDFVLKGGVSGQDSSRGNPFPQSAIGEYKVITQNYKAEYGQVGSTAITAVSRSGTNEFHGEVFYDYTDEDFRSSTPLEDVEGEKIISSQEQQGLTLSGPIIKDTLHFLISYERKDNKDPRDVISGTSAGPLPAEYAAKTGRQVSEFEEDLFFGKLNWAINDKQALEASVKFRDESEITGFGGQNTKDHGSSKDQKDTRVQVKHTYSGDRWQNNLRFTYEDSFWNPRPLTLGNGIALKAASGAGILNFGAGRSFQDKGQKGWSIQNDFTFLDLQWQGNHVIKTGIKYTDVLLKSTELQPFNPQFSYNVEFNGPGTFELVQPYRVEVGVGVEDTTNRGSIESQNKQLGVYIQDDWFITERLALNLGVRWDYEETPSYVDFATPQKVVDALRNWDNINNKNAGYDINDWISTGSNRDYFKGAWQPRVGFTYDLDSDGRYVLFGGYGRSYDRNQFDYLQIEQTNATFASTTINFQGDPDNPCSGDSCIPWDPNYLTPEGLNSLLTSAPGSGKGINLLNNTLKVPYSDQYSIGLRTSWAGWNTEATYSHVKGKDGFNWLLGNRLENGNFFAPGTNWGPPWGSSPEGFGNLLLSSNDLETRADSVFIKVSKPHLDNWGLSVAYTYTDAEENRLFSGQYTLDYPSIDGYGWEKSVGVSDQRMIMAGTYDLPWDIFLSGKLTLASPKSFQYLNCLNGNGQCVFERIEPDDGGTFTQFDMAFSKEFSTGGLIGDGTKLHIRLDLLNLFDTRNWGGFDLNRGNINSGINPNFGEHRDNLSGPPRTAKLSMAWSW